MTQVLEIDSVTFEDGGRRLVVDAVIDDAVLVRSQSYFEPAEWGPALCRGSFELHEEDVIPSSDAGFKQLISDRIDDWTPLDQSDLYD